jgi:hypothetical protein
VRRRGGEWRGGRSVECAPVLRLLGLLLFLLLSLASRLHHHLSAALSLLRGRCQGLRGWRQKQSSDTIIIINIIVNIKNIVNIINIINISIIVHNQQEPAHGAQ